MVDAADHERIAEAKKELNSLLSDPRLNKTPILIFGNKIDRSFAMSEDQIRASLGLPYKLTTGKNTPVSKDPNAPRPVEVFMCSIVERCGFKEGYQWLSKYI
jgi:GTP-binding protein SAR1